MASQCAHKRHRHAAAMVTPPSPGTEAPRQPPSLSSQTPATETPATSSAKQSFSLLKYCLGDTRNYSLCYLHEYLMEATRNP
ncbi:hypothetical protein E2C01_024964 [Portunus trituberculatus]|uniref:Uncharacterized protein n=1 Tax=Portunus trituberculatus TaxID=210409 RepID=A0A5B7EEB1_PORTR|nr:hypothetical protein [Portunus trituberculatus]